MYRIGGFSLKYTIEDGFSRKMMRGKKVRLRVKPFGSMLSWKRSLTNR
jgi:hypothetical protein